MARSSLGFRVTVCLLLLGLVGLLDELTGSELSFSLFYLVPVLFAGVFLSSGEGRSVALAAAAIWGYLEVRGREYSAIWIPLWNTGVRFVFFWVINDLAGAVRRAHVRERELSRRDTLTGVANRRVFAEWVAQAIARLRKDGQPFTMVYVDLDRFKQVNDTHGHAEGDRVLQAVAEVLQRQSRGLGGVARLGGDEFGMLLTAVEPQAVWGMLARAVEALEREVGDCWGVGATFGAVTFVRPPQDVDAVIQTADALMYSGKAQERGMVLHRLWPQDFRDFAA